MRSDRRARCLRGQVWSLDLLIATTFLFLVLILYVLVWQQLDYVYSDAVGDTALLGAAIRASDALLLSPGDPANWTEMAVVDEYTVHSFGLADRRNVLNLRKVQRMQEMNGTHYDFMRQQLGVSPHQLHISVLDDNENVLYSAGREPTEGNETAVVERVGLLNGTEAFLVVRVWG